MADRLPESSHTQRSLASEEAPSAMLADEPSVARFFGMTGVCAVLVGCLAVFLNTRGSRLIGPATGTAMIMLGLVGMLFHAARDADRIIRHAYQGFGLAAVLAGIVFSLLPQPNMGDWFFPWGVAGLLGGMVFLLAGSCHEDEPLFKSFTLGTLGGGGVILAAVGFIGAAIAPQHLPKFTGAALLGLLYWWSAVGLLGSFSDRGYRFGWVLGIVGLAALVFAIGRSALPPMFYSFGWLTQTPQRFFVPRGLVIGSLGALYALLSIGLCSERAIVAMTRRELAAYFYSPIAYIVLAGMAFIGWLQYWQFVISLLADAGRAVPEPIIANYIVQFLPVFSIMFVVPVVTMRLLSEEHRTGTVEMLLTVPVSEWQVVLSKFFAAMIYFLVLVIPWALLIIPVYLEGRDGFDYLPLMSFYVALLCSGAAFISMGLFFSSLTRNQIIAAVLTFAGMIVYFLFFIIAREMPQYETLAAFARQLSFIHLWIKAINGRLPLYSLVTYLSVTVFWLYLTTKVLESRKWN